MTIVRTRDAELIRATFTHPTQWSAATDDSAPRPEDFRTNEDERIIYLAVYDHDVHLGIITLIPQNAVCYEIHAALLPASWGGRATAALREAIAWGFEHTAARRIVATIPATNRLAIALAHRAGMKVYGTNSRSFMKRGALLDQILLGISK